MRNICVFAIVFLQYHYALSADAEFQIEKSWKVGKCPCDDESLCKPITDTTRKEIFIFSLNNKPEIWSKYNWTKITTIVMVGYVSPEVMCFAHKHGVRAVIINSFPTNQLTNATARSDWVQTQLKLVTDNYLDGINIDYEDAIPQSMPQQKLGLTQLVAETYKAFKSHDPHLQVTVDVAWSPRCIDSRCYDYAGISHYTDFIFVMSYDEQSQIFGPCVAGANSGYYKTRQGVQYYRDLNIPANKMVLGIPWYGYVYKCLNVSKGGHCEIEKVPFRNVSCSDAAGKETNYGYIMEVIKNSTDGRIWDDSSLTPYFNFQKGVSDRAGRYVKTALWHSAGDDVAGMVARCEKIVNTAEGVLDGEVYHYYTKLMMKEPKNEETGGGHEWHQDYGYWYQNDILFPDMITVFIAIDRAHKGNGCLQILEGSNNCGRIDHKMVAGQQGADVDRVNAIAKVCPLKYVELEPGDTLFFHGNLLHCSAPNNSQDRRYAFLITYNKATNNPVKEHHFKSYTPLKKVPDSSIRQCTNYNIEDFYDPDVQKTIIPKKFGAEQSG